MKHVVACVAIVLLAAFALIATGYFVVISGIVFFFGPNPPKPSIEYGEFPITVTYEVEGEMKTLSDTVVCEFDGFENLGSAGKYRKWKSYLKSGQSRLVLLAQETEGLTIEICDSYGFPDYYMGDFIKSREEYEEMMDNGYLDYIQWEDGMPSGRLISEEEAWEKYKLKIIKIEYSQPILNSFN